VCSLKVNWLETNNQTQINFTDPSKVTGLTTNPDDLIIGDEIGLTSLPVGGNGQILFIEHGSPVWITPSNDSLGVHDDSKFSYLYNENDLTINNKNRLIFEKLNSSILVINESNKLNRGGDITTGHYGFGSVAIAGNADHVYLTFGKWRIAAAENGTELKFEYNNATDDAPANWQVAVPFIVC